MEASLSVWVQILVIVCGVLIPCICVYRGRGMRARLFRSSDGYSFSLRMSRGDDGCVNTLTLIEVFGMEGASLELADASGLRPISHRELIENADDDIAFQDAIEREGESVMFEGNSVVDPHQRIELAFRSEERLPGVFTAAVHYDIYAKGSRSRKILRVLG